MADLTLPYYGSLSSDGIVFWIRQPDSAGTAIRAESYGTDPYGDIPIGVAAQVDSGGTAVWANSDNGTAVYAQSNSGTAVWAKAATAGYFESTGGWAVQVLGSDSNDAVNVTSSAAGHAAVSANNFAAGGYGLWANSPNGTAIYGQGEPAGYFSGDVLVTGDLILVNTLVSSGGDVAEDFDVEAAPLNTEPGTVLVIDENGTLRASDVPYDTRVAGVVAGGGNLKPGVILQRVLSPKHRAPLALVGKAFCKVDTTFGKIVAGDLLTTSRTPGHAMKATDRSRAVGAIVGKALAGLDSGLGLIPMLVSPR